MPSDPEISALPGFTDPKAEPAPRSQLELSSVETSAQIPVGRRSSENPPWTGLDVLVLAAVMLFAASLFTVTAISIAMARHVDGTSFGHAAGANQDLQLLLTDVRVVLPAQFMAYVVVLVFMVQILRRRYRQNFLSAIKWNWPSAKWPSFLFVGVGLAFAISLLSRFLPETKNLPIDALFQGPRAAYMLAGFGIFVAPFMEEFFFRGFLYPVLARRLGLLWAVVLTAVGFMSIHASQLAESWGPLLVLFLVGSVLTLVRAFKQSVAASVLVHMGYNGTLFIMLYVATQGFRHLEPVTR